MLMRGAVPVTAIATTLGSVIGIASIASAAGAPRAAEPVEIVAHTTGPVSAFESTLEGCTTGVVTDAGVHATFTPWGGVFNGDKVFTCASGDDGFTLRLKARFGAEGSTGTWVVVEGYGSFAGLKGSGTLVGTRIGEAQIDDAYTGILR
jgi:hypothetical protein